MREQSGGHIHIEGTGNVVGNNNTVHVSVPRPTISYLHQIPSPPADFTGREKELEELHSAIAYGGIAISGLAGMGGVGKTALALQLAYELKDAYTDASLYLDLRGMEAEPVSPIAALQHFIRAFEPQLPLPETLPQLEAIYRSLLEDKRAIVLLDNAKDDAQIIPLLPPHSCALIVTSRNIFSLPGLTMTRLNAMAPKDSIQLFLKIVPRVGSTADALRERLGDLPLALRLAASFLAERPNVSPDQYLEKLNDVLARPEMKPVEASLSLSLGQFDELTQQRWCALSIFPTTFDQAAVSALWELDGKVTHEALGELLKYSMVEWEETADRYHLHDLARDFASASLTNENRVIHTKKHISYYLLQLIKIDSRFTQGNEAQIEVLKWFDIEWPHIEFGQRIAQRNANEYKEFAKLCVLYAVAAPTVFHARLPAEKRLIISSNALELSRHLGMRDAENELLGISGLAHMELGESAIALKLFQEQAILSEALGDYRDLGNALMNMGNIHRESKQLGEALDLGEQALAIFKQTSNRMSEAKALGNIANIYQDLHLPHKSIPLYAESLKISEEVGDLSTKSYGLLNTANIYDSMGLHSQALDLYREALIIARDLKDLIGEAGTLFNMSVSLQHLNRHEDAIASAEESLHIFEQIKHPNSDRVREQLKIWQEYPSAKNRMTRRFVRMGAYLLALLLTGSLVKFILLLLNSK